MKDNILRAARAILPLLAVAPSPLAAQTPTSPTPDSLTPDQKGYIAYNQCLLHAAIRASRTDAPDDAIYGLAKAQCAPVRASVIRGQESNREYLAALDAADAEKAANFPAWIKGVRERRRQFEATAPALPPPPQ